MARKKHEIQDHLGGMRPPSQRQLRVGEELRHRLAELLRPGELLEVARQYGLRVVAYEDGLVEVPKTAFMQRICAVREAAAGADAPAPARYRLDA